MALSWSGRRQLIYYGVGIIILAVLVWGVWASFFNAAPTCQDGKQDGTELGIDCGGSCALLCADTSKDPTVLWARPFIAGANSYTLAAYVQNNNVGAGSKGVPYSFQLFDANNSLVKEVDGVADLPPVTIVPIVVPNISVGNRIVTHVQFAFSAIPVWTMVPEKALSTLHVSELNHSDDWTRVSATLSNQTLNDAKKITVVVVLYDSNHVARAASKSLVQVVGAKSSSQVVFTWPTATPDIVQAEITVLPSF